MAKKSNVASASAAKGVKLDPGMKTILEKEPGLKTTLQQIEKSFGDGSIMPLGASQKLTVQGIPTGSLSLDMALGGQGIPRGRIIEVFGPESSGKT
ncbi:MAG: DNA recombination/repair protein RecA, partial [Planctomycetota bacterium]